MHHNIRKTLILAAGTVALLASGVICTGRAHAAVFPVRPVTLVVTVSGPSARIGLDAVSTAPMFRDGGHGVVLRDGPMVIFGTGAGDNSTGTALVHVGGTVASRLLTPGTTTATLTDVGDGGVAGIRLTVLRASRVTLGPVAAVGSGLVLVTGQSSHYDLASGGYRGDAASPVLLQVLTAGKWTAVSASTTAPDGSVCILARLAPGRQVLRLVRPAGATVTGGASASHAAPAS